MTFLRVCLFLSLVLGIQAIALLPNAICQYGTEGFCGTFMDYKCPSTAKCTFLDKNLADDAGLCCTKKDVTVPKKGTCPNIDTDSDSDECDGAVNKCNTDFDCNGQEKCCKNSCGKRECIEVNKFCDYNRRTYHSGQNFAGENFGCDDCYCIDGEVLCTERFCEMKA